MKTSHLSKSYGQALDRPGGLSYMPGNILSWRCRTGLLACLPVRWDRRFRLSALTLLLSLPAAAAITVYPPSISLTGRNASQLLAVSSGDRDITADCAFQLSNTAIASVSKTGLITAVADGRSTLTVSCKGERATVPVAVGSP